MAIEQWGFSAWHTYCDTEHPFKMAISENLWHYHLLPDVWHLFYDLGLSRPGIEPRSEAKTKSKFDDIEQLNLFDFNFLTILKW